MSKLRLWRGLSRSIRMTLPLLILGGCSGGEGGGTDAGAVDDAAGHTQLGSGGTGGSGGVVGSGGLSGSGGEGPIGSGGDTGGGGTGSGGRGSGGNGSGGVAGSGGKPGSGGSTTSGPCDIYADAGTACVAAHSTVRALYAAYSGNLYQVRRRSDKATKDIPVLSPGGFANSAVQDQFCTTKNSCTISIIYDQSPRSNHLKVAPGGGAVATADVEAWADGIKLTVGGHPVYGVYVQSRSEGRVGYRNNATTGVAKLDQPEGMYMVAGGRHYNDLCCFDYGNAETNNRDNGNGTMEAIYFGTATTWGEGSGSGPWVMADLENGLFAGPNLGTWSANTPLIADYVTGLVKGKANHFAIKGGNAQTGSLKTMYDGARPTLPGYNPMKKEGAIILGIGGDNSNWDVGTFFEGCMTYGYPTDTADDAVQANIVAAGYGK